MALSHLLAFASLYFPEVEARDSTRIHLRMLICIPGNKLRLILNPKGQLAGIVSIGTLLAFTTASKW